MMQYATERCMPPSLLPGLPANEAALRGFLLGEIASVESRIGRLYPPSSSCAAAVASDDFTVYTGTAGVALFYWAVGVGSMAGGGGVGCGRQHMPKAIEYINTVLRSCAGGGGRMRSRRVSTFMTGMAGVYAVAAAIYSSQGDRSKAAQFAGKVLEQAQTALQEGVPSELLYGRTGYLSCLLFLEKHCGVRLDEHADIISRIISLVIRDGKSLSGDGWPLMWEWHGKKYLGAAHGVAGILTVLLSLRGQLELLQCEDLVHATVDRIIQAACFASGNLKSSVGSTGGDSLVHWCHGATGLVPLMCLSFRLWKDERYLACARLAADNVASRGLLKKGFGICHGISGSGLSLLCMHRADPSSGKGYAETAARMALFSCLEGDVKDALLRQPDRPQSLMEGTAAWAVS